jgi:hypothetical protein
VTIVRCTSSCSTPASSVSWTTCGRSSISCTHAPVRQFKQFIWFERAEPPSFMATSQFNTFRSEDDDVTSEAKMAQLAQVYLAKAKEITNDVALGVVRDYFQQMNANVRAFEKATAAAEPSHLDALLAFAARAYRRPMTKTEADDLRAFYHSLREQRLSHEDAIRDAVVSVLMSPHFVYRVDPLTDDRTSGGDVRPLSSYELANRLSYFLWSSMPDDELMKHAAAGDLQKPDVLAAQARRMMQHRHVRQLATEFAGNWLDIRRFEEHNAVDRERFPVFTSQLREAMFEEPIRFVQDVMQRDGSVLDFLYGNYTFVNPILAKHYGMPEPPAGTWARVDDAQKYARGGLLPMSVFLTKNAPGLRTSPVKRGYWIVHRLLGEYIPGAAAERSRSADRRNQAGRPDAARDARPAPRESRLLQLPREIRLVRARVRRLRSDRRDPRSRSRGTAGRDRRDVPGRQRGVGSRRTARVHARARAEPIRRQPVPRAARLCPGPQPAALGRAAGR